MSRSVARVAAALAAAGLETRILEMASETRTAVQAAAAAGCELDQIVKSIVFRGERSGHVVLFLTAGGNRVDPGRAALLAGEPLGKADAALVRAETGFVIGGVAPVGHLRAPRTFLDPRLDDFAVVWAAAGTPFHIFAIAPADLRRITAAVPGAFTA
ncbi:MAG: YbaK/EbsC family protein [Rhodobacteraceae bacterium]|jgi:prolyl-tRNA editing enzyme YbaK/EbsC (Cys-tRNA(Pro) deacylase)|nr:YbaK/EbsC family protein [Paracoccaceae bacterium]